MSSLKYLVRRARRLVEEETGRRIDRKLYIFTNQSYDYQQGSPFAYVEDYLVEAHIMLEPEYFKSINSKELLGLLIHEILHIAHWGMGEKRIERLTRRICRQHKIPRPIEVEAVSKDEFEAMLAQGLLTSG